MPPRICPNSAKQVLDNDKQQNNQLNEHTLKTTWAELQMTMIAYK